MYLLLVTSLFLLLSYAGGSAWAGQKFAAVGANGKAIAFYDVDASPTIPGDARPISDAEWAKYLSDQGALILKATSNAGYVTAPDPNYVAPSANPPQGDDFLADFRAVFPSAISYNGFLAKYPALAPSVQQSRWADVRTLISAANTDLTSSQRDAIDAALKARHIPAQ